MQDALIVVTYAQRLWDDGMGLEEGVRHAAERGRSLTRQLLAFARRQHLSPKTLDVNALTGEFGLLVKQAVGEAITVSTELGEGPLNGERASIASLRK